MKELCLLEMVVDVGTAKVFSITQRDRHELKMTANSILVEFLGWFGFLPSPSNNVSAYEVLIHSQQNWNSIFDVKVLLRQQAAGMLEQPMNVCCYFVCDDADRSGLHALACLHLLKWNSSFFDDVLNFW